MKQILFFIGFIFIGLSAFSQVNPASYEFKIGEEIKKPKNIQFLKVLSKDTSGIYVLKAEIKYVIGGFEYKKFIISYMDNNFNELKTQELPINFKNGKIYYKDVVILKNKYYILFTNEISESKKQYLLSQEIDLKLFTTKGDLLEKGEINYAKFSNDNTGEFKISTSLDSSKILIFYNKPYDNKSNEKIGVYAYSKSLKLLWEKELTLPYSDKLFTISSISIDNKANVHIIGKYYLNKMEEVSKTGTPNYTYKIISFLNKGELIVENDLPNNSKFLKDLHLIPINSDKLICFGFYSNKDGAGIVGGTYMYTLNPITKEGTNLSFNKIKLERINRPKTDVEKEMDISYNGIKPQDSLNTSNFVIRKIIPYNDGGMLVIAEKYRETVHRVEGSTGGYEKQIQYNYGDIMAIKIDGNTNVLWARIIPKFQFSTNDFGIASSFYFTEFKNKLYFVFNEKDFSSLEERKLMINPAKYKVTSLYVLADNGKLERSVLTNYKSIKVDVLPQFAFPISKNEILLYGYSLKKFRYLKLKLK